MSNLIDSTTDLGKAVVALPAIESLSSAIQGQVITPTSDGYDEARSLWNAMIDRRPSLIVRCVNTQDIVQSVRFAKANSILVAVRGAGHNIAGNACCDGGIVIDLSQMKAIQVDPDNRTVVVEPGVTLGELDAATQRHGLAVPLGINSTTGVSGLTLGGGFGWTSRKYGMTIDNLLAAEVVLANGEVVTASETVNPDLFWGLRGGGGNLGVVSSFTYRLNRVGPEIYGGLIAHPFEKAGEMLRFYRSFTETLPDDVTIWVVMRKAPPVPFVPSEYHGKEAIVFIVAAIGDPEVAKEQLRPLREHSTPIVDTVGPMSFVDLQQAFDPLMAKGMRNYWKTHNFENLSDGFIDRMVEAIWSLPGPHCEAFIGNTGGAMSRIAPDAMAYHDRRANYIINIHARWETPEEDQRCIRWCRDLYEDTAQYATGEAYVNFMSGDEADRVKLAYGPNYARLVELKMRYDPSNLFCMNQNIKPGPVDARML